MMSKLPKNWTQKQVDYVTENWKSKTDPEIAHEIGKTPGQVAGLRKKLGFNKAVHSSKPLPVKKPLTIDDLIKKYEDDIDNVHRLENLKTIFSESEIKTFVAKYEFYRNSLDVVEAADIATIEQLITTEISNHRVLKHQKSLETLADKEEALGNLHASVAYREKAIELSRQTKDLSFQFEKFQKMLVVTREQRMKNRLNVKLSFANVIAQIEERRVSDRTMKYGELLKASTKKKEQTMKDEGLILVSESFKETEKNHTQEDQEENQESQETSEETG